MEPQFVYMMIFLGLAVVVIIILLFTISWNNSSQPVVPPVNLPVNAMGDSPPLIPSNVDKCAVYSYSLSTVPMVDPQPTPAPNLPPSDPTQTPPPTQPSPRPPPPSTTSVSDNFSKYSVKLLVSLFDSIDSIVVNKPDQFDVNQQVKDNAMALANLLCDQTNGENLVKSYVNLNGLLQEYTKLCRDKYLDKSEFSDLSSGFDDRSVSPVMHLNPGSSSKTIDVTGSGNDLKNQAGILTLVINGIIYNCLELSAGSNDSFKTYLRSLNILLFRYSELLATSKYNDAKEIRAKAIAVASGAILSN